MERGREWGSDSDGSSSGGEGVSGRKHSVKYIVKIGSPNSDKDKEKVKEKGSIGEKIDGKMVDVNSKESPLKRTEEEKGKEREKQREKEKEKEKQAVGSDVEMQEEKSTRRSSKGAISIAINDQPIMFVTPPQQPLPPPDQQQ